MYAGGQLEKNVGPRMTCFIGAAMISSGTYLSSYCKSISTLVFCQVRDLSQALYLVAGGTSLLLPILQLYITRVLLV